MSNSFNQENKKKKRKIRKEKGERRRKTEAAVTEANRAGSKSRRAESARAKGKGRLERKAQPGVFSSKLPVATPSSPVVVPLGGEAPLGSSAC